MSVGIVEYATCNSLRPPPQRVSWYDTKQSDDGDLSIELWGIWSTSSCHCSPIYTDLEW